MTDGVTIKICPVAKGCQVKERLGGTAIIVSVDPAHKAPPTALLTCINGTDTETVTMAGLMETQPNEFVPMARYDVVVVGETTIELEFGPLLQL